MKAKTKKRVILTLALAIIMTCAMSITAFASGAPTGLRQTESTTTSFTVEWNAVPGADGYFVYKSKDNVNWVPIWNKWEDANDNGLPECDANVTNCKTSLYLQPGTTYYVRVVPAYSLGPFSYSKGTPSASIAVVTTPNDVNKVTQTKASSKGVTIKWSPVAGATSYNIYCSDDNDKKVASTKNTSVTIKQTAGTKKKYLVCPVRTSGTFSAEGSKTTASLYGGGAVQAKSVPRQPVYVANSKKENLAWDLKTNKVTLSADKHNKDMTCDGFQYVIYSANGKKKLKTTVKDRWTDVTFKLKAVKNAGFQVMARGYTTINGKKYYGAWSAKQVVIPQPVVKVPDGIHTSTATIKWSKISGATKYYVYVAKNYSSPFATKNYKRVATVNAKKTSYKISGLKKGRYYSVYVVPVVKIGKKSYKGVAGKYTWEGYRSNY
ncbi:MAG: fibronectin type III domain-containing protein [Lachnospiraceae bacterium]|nr:fibronectin type III domain-containing protein [Lachnospiraceae bacterium]